MDNKETTLWCPCITFDFDKQVTTTSDTEMAEAAVPGAPDKPEERYRRLYEFNLQTNRRFLEGWCKLVDIVPQDQMTDSYLKASVYFYSREVEPVDLECFRSWLKDNDKQLTLPDKQTMQEISAAAAKRKEESSSTSADTPSNTSEAQADSQAGRHPISFPELIAMVHNGIPLPDTEGIAVEPTNEEPSSPVMQRPKKPWEINAS